MKRGKQIILIAAVVFALVAFAHLLRVFFPFPLILGSFSFPLWASGCSFLLAGLLSGWLLRSFWNQ